MRVINHYQQYVLGVGLCLVSAFSVATDFSKINNWDVDGEHGVLHVHGALTESACRLAMSSAWQTVELGNLGTARVQKVGQQGTPIAVHLRLEDCLVGESRNYNKLGNLLWAPEMPALKIRFLAPADNNNLSLVKVNGAEGIALLLSDASKHKIVLGEFSPLTLLTPGQNELTYYITPVRTKAGVNPGEYHAQIQFQLSYD